ncbi:hypothetical protein ACJMK2_042860 [Sinanodonta woodiana]|uniref:Uncharacterized protein n=1 Tax=Sinanodonta woodiana TaxID=1069815 RepID=A0ABD3VWS6_SINWO
MLPNIIFYDSGCYRSKGSPIEIIDHNFHAWGINEGDFPREKRIRYYENADMLTWIKNNYTDPVNVWLFSSDGDKYDQFVTAQGEIYRTESLQNSMEEFARRYINDETAIKNSTSFTKSSIAAQFARERNSWKPTRKRFVDDVKASCVEYGHGGLWNTKYDFNDMMSVDMIACYPGSFLGGGECNEYYIKFGLPTHKMVRRAINGPLPDYTLTGFAKVESFKFADGLHTIKYVWIGKHLYEKQWCPTVLLRYMLDKHILTDLIISEVIFSCDKQTDVWLPTPEEFPGYEDEFLHSAKTSECKAFGRIIIGKFTQGAGDICVNENEDEPKEVRRRKTAKLILDPGELKFVIDDAVSKGIFARQTKVELSGEPFGTIVEYFSDEMPQWTHLRSYMLAYVTINLHSMVNRFPDIAGRVATDSLYYDKKYHNRVKEYLSDGETWGSWRVKNELLHIYRESADVGDKPTWKVKDGNDLVKSIAPSIHDPISHQLVYLDGPGGCGKTTRVCELFRGSDLIVLTPTHRLARDFHEKKIPASTYHSFFRYRGDDWTPERMGTKKIPDVVI